MLISVIICTYNRADKIVKCLDSIHESLKNAPSVDAQNAEIVIVNNNSTDNTVDIIEQWTTKSDFPIHLVTETKQGIAWARNRSFETAKGDILISIDDDCCMDKNHIKNTLAHYEKDTQPVLRFGQLELGDQEDWPMTVQTRPVVKRWQKGVADYDYLGMGDVCSANMVIPRAIIDAIGRYDNRFGTKQIPGGEDADFGFRVYNAGFLMEYVPDIIAQHYHGRRTAEAVQKLVKGYSIAAGALYAKHHVHHPRLAKAFSSKEFPADPPGKYDNDARKPEIRAFHKQSKKFYILGAFMFMKAAFKQRLLGQQ
tara:strand:- start:28438 stop:29370 length:933 start_codon:yes stop_codon:yes gene_type:complete